MRKIDQGNLGLLQGGGEKDEGGRERNLGDGEAPGHEGGEPATRGDPVETREGRRAGGQAAGVDRSPAGRPEPGGREPKPPRPAIRLREREGDCCAVLRREEELLKGLAGLSGMPSPVPTGRERPGSDGPPTAQSTEEFTTVR